MRRLALTLLALGPVLGASPDARASAQTKGGGQVAAPTKAASPRPHSPVAPRPHSPVAPRPGIRHADPRELLSRSLRPSGAVTTVVVETSTHEVTMARLPVATLPPGLSEDTPAPTVSPPTAPEAWQGIAELRLVAVDSTGGRVQVPLPSGDAGDPGAGATSPRRAVRIEASGPGVSAMSWGHSTPSMSGLTGACEAPRTGSRGSGVIQELRWHQLTRQPDGSFRLVNGSGWFNRATCKLAPGARSEVPLTAVAMVDGQPIALAAAVGGQILLVTPQLQAVQQEGALDKREASRSTGGLLTRHLIRPVRGGASSLAALLPRSTWQQWRSALGAAADDSTSGLPALAVRFDLSQAIGEPTPLALLTVQKPVGHQSRVSPSAATSSGLATGIRIKQPARGGDIRDPFSSQELD